MTAKQKLSKTKGVSEKDVLPRTTGLSIHEMCSFLLEYLSTAIEEPERTRIQKEYSTFIGYLESHQKEGKARVQTAINAFENIMGAAKAMKLDVAPLFVPGGQHKPWIPCVQLGVRLEQVKNGRREGLLTLEEGQQEYVKRAFGALAQILKADCWTAYYWDRAINRARLFAWENLWWPQTLQGLDVRQDLPRQALFAAERAPQMRRIPDQSAAGTFRRRERIAQAWGVFLRTSRMRFVLFLNWRTGSALPTWNPDDIQPALSYLNGWLEESGVDFKGKPLNWGSTFPEKLREFMSNILDPNTVEEKWLKEALGLGLPTESGDQVRIRKYDPQKKAILFTEDGLKDCATESDEDGLVQRGISAQSVAWEASLLIPDLDAPMFAEDHPLRKHPPRKSWREHGVYAQTRRPPGGELAVPVVREHKEVHEDGRTEIKEKIIAVANIEHRNHRQLTPDCQHRAEAIVRLFQVVHELRGWSDEHIRKFGMSVLSEDWELNTARGLLSKFIRFAVTTVGADLGMVMMYDADLRSFVPEVVAGSRASRMHYLASFKNRFDGAFQTKCAETIDRDKDPVGLLCDDGSKGYLLPGRRGLTWQVFVENRAQHIEEFRSRSEQDGKTEGVPRFCRSGVVAPLRAGERAAPQGVVWLIWGMGSEKKSESELRTAHESILPVLKLAAALFPFLPQKKPGHDLPERSAPKDDVLCKSSGTGRTATASTDGKKKRRLKTGARRKA